jgi:hypothetical protein
MTSFATLISLFVPIIIGFGFVRTCIPGEKHLCRHDWLRLFLGIGVGFGLCSCTLFVWLLTYGAVHVAYITVEIGLAIMFGALAAYRATGCSLCKSSMAPKTTLTQWERPLLIVFGLILVSACLSFALEARIHPEGQGDAWAIWNLRARFLFRGGEQWRNAFSGTLFWSHPDYPLLLPGLVARSWIYTGTETQNVPIGIAMLFTFATAGVLTAGLSALAGREKALLAGIVLLGTASFIKLGAAEYADVPIAFFFLASIVLLCMLDRLPMSGAVLLGISAAFAAWTKNEGLLLFVVLLITLKWTRQPPSRVLMGAFCVLTLLAIFKLSLAPPNDLVQNLRTVLLRNVTDPSRYLSVVTGFIYELINFGSKRFNPLVPLFAALLLLKKDAKYGARSAVIILWGVITGIYFVYLVAPVDVAWQIAWSLDRVLLQLWPATLFTCFYIIDFPTAPRTAITRQSLHLSPPLASRRVP